MTARRVIEFKTGSADSQAKPIPWTKTRDWLFESLWAAMGLLLSFLLFVSPICAQEINYPQNLWEGLVAEDTGGDYQVYLVIASVVHNRLAKGMSHGLVALRRQNLRQFVKKNCDYVLKTKGIDLQRLATRAIQEVFVNGKNYANGATYYEHTGIYGIPRFWKDLEIVGVMYKGTRKEIGLAR